MSDNRYHHQTASAVNRIVLLGASNLTLSVSLITQLIQQRFEGPSDLLISAGHGRSYGHHSRVLIRGLPGIASCGLWSRLESADELPTYAFLTDIGNDIPYGHAPEQVLEWIAYCIEKLVRHKARIVVINLSMELVESLSERHVRVVRSLFFPFSRLSFDELVRRARVVHRGLEEMASRMEFELYEPEPCWYGPDIIHVLYWKRRAFYARIIDRFPSFEQQRERDGGNALRKVKWRRRPRFACQDLLGWERRHAQPSGLLCDGSIVSLY